MMAIDLKADVTAMLADFGEIIVYRPYAKPARSITALVNRRPREVFDETGTPLPKLSIAVANDEFTGISSSSMDIGRDRVEVAERYGEARTVRLIGEIIGEHDAGMIELEVR
jgi:hypothetical protein